MQITSLITVINVDMPDIFFMNKSTKVVVEVDDLLSGDIFDTSEFDCFR